MGSADLLDRSLCTVHARIRHNWELLDSGLVGLRVGMYNSVVASRMRRDHRKLPDRSVRTWRRRSIKIHRLARSMQCA